MHSTGMTVVIACHQTCRHLNYLAREGYSRWLLEGSELLRASVSST